MTSADEPIEDYLDELYSALPAAARPARRILAEAEDHLREATADGLARGLSESEARREAVTRFGSAARFARASRGSPWRPPTGAVLRDLARAAVPMVAIGLIAIGISGGVAAAMNAVFGATFVGGAPAGAHYAAATCAHFLAIHPGAGTCARAATLENSQDAVALRLPVGALGLLILAVSHLLGRRPTACRTRSTLPEVFLPTLGFVTFGAAGAILTGLVIDGTFVGGAAGRGFYLSGGLVALVTAAAYALPLNRALAGRPLARN